MYGIVIFLPLVSAIVSLCGGYYIGSNGARILTSTCLVTAAIISYILFYEIGLLHQQAYLYLGNWVTVGLLSINYSFQFDSITVSRLVIVNTVASLVHIYSSSYRSEDPHIPRFRAYLSLFTFFMVILITADNFRLLLVGWEGVGLCSYLLINFWSTRLQANKAALKARLYNRIGDIGLRNAFFCIFYLTLSLDFSSATRLYSKLHRIPYYRFEDTGWLRTWGDLIGSLLFLGVIGKSAQIGLHAWLPDAREGPTPVSALIHAATMVTAGVFLCVRCALFFEVSNNIRLLLVFLGGLTAFLASVIGMYQNDIKRIIAYSTCSQLGYRILATGVGAYEAALFHLLTHASYKALLFLSAGSVIHALKDEQDIEKMGGLVKLLPFTYIRRLIGSLALTGFPFRAGYYSKDIILELAYTRLQVSGLFFYWLGSRAAFNTAFYSIRLLYRVFLRDSNIAKSKLSAIHEGSPLLLIPLGVLGILSITIGYYMQDIFVGLGSDFFSNSIYSGTTIPTNTQGSYNIIFVDAEFTPYYIVVLPTILSLLGRLISFLLHYKFARYLQLVSNKNIGRQRFGAMAHSLHFDKGVNYVCLHALSFCFSITYITLDKGILEIMGLSGIFIKSAHQSQEINEAQVGVSTAYSYLSILLLSFTIFITYFYPS